MNTKRLTAALLAWMMTASLCACGDDPAAEKPVSDPVEVADSVSADSAETAAESETPTENQAETSDSDESADTEKQGAAPVNEDELAEVQRVADAYFKAMEENDYEALLDVYDVEMLYHLQNGEMGDREKYLKYLKETVNEVNDSSLYDGNTTFGDPICANEEAESYNEFFRVFDYHSEGKTALAENFKVDGVYNVRMKAGGSVDTSNSTDESGINIDFNVSGDFNIEMDIPILHINGAWKVDPAIGKLKSFYQMITDMMSESQGDTTINGESASVS